jgi:hypothetical protein
MLCVDVARRSRVIDVVLDAFAEDLLEDRSVTGPVDLGQGRSVPHAGVEVSRGAGDLEGRLTGVDEE